MATWVEIIGGVVAGGGLYKVLDVVVARFGTKRDTMDENRDWRTDLLQQIDEEREARRSDRKDFQEILTNLIQRVHTLEAEKVSWEAVRVKMVEAEIAHLERVAEKQRQLNDRDAQIAALEARVAELETEVATLKAKVAE